MKIFNVDNNGNYFIFNFKGKFYEKAIKEEDEYNILMDIVLNV